MRPFSDDPPSKPLETEKDRLPENEKRIVDRMIKALRLARISLSEADAVSGSFIHDMDNRAKLAIEIYRELKVNEDSTVIEK